MRLLSLALAAQRKAALARLGLIGVIILMVQAVI